MKRKPARWFHHRSRILPPLLLLALCVWMSRVEDDSAIGMSAAGGDPTVPAAAAPRSAVGDIANVADAVAVTHFSVKPPAPGAPWAVLESDGFTPQSRELAAALDAGNPLRVRAPDGGVREFLMRPRRLLGDNFQITLGTERGAKFDAGLRSYEGRETAGGAAIHAAIAGGAFAAEIEETDGATTYLRTDEVTGVLRTLRRTREQKRMTCEHDPVRGIASTKSDQPPVTEDDWRDAAEAGIEPVIAASSGFDPGTGRLDKYVQPIAWGHNYEISLRDNLAIVTLDKLATGANTMARLTQITSEYLAKSANLASIQENNLGVRYLLQELILTPDDVAYTDVPVSLGDYGWWISQRRPRGTYGWDLSTRFGNGGFSGGTIGVAWVRSLGTTSPVNTCQRGYNVELEAHEQGHNMGSDHSSGGIMNSSVNGSRDFFTDVFAGETSAMQIWKHAASRLTGSSAMRHAEQTPWAVDDSVETPAGQPVDILPLTNDRAAVRNGETNAIIRVDEVSRIYPMHAGSAELVTPERIRFTPSPGYEGPAWFSYSLRGSVGNGGAGWLHKGDIAVQIGTWDRNDLRLRLAPGQEFSFRPSSTTDTTIISQPAHARVDTARDDRRLIIIRVLATAVGTDSFVIQRAGVDDTVTLTYVTDFLRTVPDTFQMATGQTSLRFSPMANDQGAGYRNMADVRPIVGLPAAGATGVSFFPGAFRFTGATLTDPAKGSLALSTRRFTLDSTATPTYSGHLTFTPAANARGVARVNYSVQDAAGATQSNQAVIILPLGGISSPATDPAVIAPQHGLVLEAAVWPTAEAPLSGLITSRWSVESAPNGASVVFDDAEATRTGAMFSHPGTYRLGLSLTDNGFVTRDEIRVVVEASPNGPADSLVAWWKLDETSGTAALDASGAGRHGLLSNGITRSIGIIGPGSLTADGTDDFVELTPNTAAVQSLAQGSISLWFRSNGASLRPIFSASDNRDPDRYLRIYLENGILKFIVLGDIGTGIASLASPGTANDNQWHHAAVTVDASRNARLFLDGVLVSEGLRPFFNGVFNLSSMAIGRTVRSNGTDHWRGGVDDVRIYSRPLSGDEVLSLARLSENRGPLIVLGEGPVVSGSRSISTSILQPSITDDGRPLPSVSRLWTARGPGGISFVDPNAEITGLTAPSVGTWRLRLEAWDGGVRTWRETPATFTGDDPGAPWSRGLAPVRAALGSPPVQVSLFDAFGDPDGTSEALAFTVTTNSNPALFASVSVPATLPRQLVLAFPPATPGTAILTLRATDAGGAFVESPLRVTVENFAPLVPTAVFSVSENAPAGTVVGTLEATDPEGAALRYAIAGGNVLDAFSLDPVSGVLRVATPFAVDYETRPVFALTVRVSEAAEPGSFTDTPVLVSLANMNEAPAFAPQYFTLRAGAPVGTSVGTLTAGDPEGNAISFAITGGNAAGGFSISAGNTLTVASAAALDILTTPRFTMTLTATDDSVPPAVTTAVVRVTLEAALVAQGSALRWRVPVSAPVDGYAWIQRAYNDSSWSSGTSGIGYDTSPDYRSLLGTDVQADMFNARASLFVRLPFTLPDAARVGRLTLRMKYEDGFVAWINGTVVARHGAPDPAAWNSVATDARDEDAAVTFRDDDLTAFMTTLATGENMLAIQGLNESAASTDLLILPELVWSPSGTAAVPDLPVITAGTVTPDAATGSAVVSGELTATGGEPVRIMLWWGRVDGGNSPAGWEQSATLPGDRSAAAVSHTVSALRPETRYFFRFSAGHSGGDGWSGSIAYLTPPSPGAADYGSWIASFPQVPEVLAGASADADGDGLSNFLEYGLGGDPSLAADADAIRPVVSFTAHDGQPVFDVSWRRRLDRAVRGLDYQIELSPASGSGWMATAGTPVGDPVATGDGITERLALRFVLPAGDLRHFIRLRVTRAGANP